MEPPYQDLPQLSAESHGAGPFVGVEQGTELTAQVCEEISSISALSLIQRRWLRLSQ